MTIDLVKAGADLEARRPEGTTPLFLAAQQGYSEVTAVLIEAGVVVDSRAEDGTTTLMRRRCNAGHTHVLRQLLRAKASPLLSRTSPHGRTFVPLDAAAFRGSSEVVRELIQGVE